MVSPSELRNFGSDSTKDGLSMLLESYSCSDRTSCMQIDCNLGQRLVTTQRKWSLVSID